VQQRKRGEKNSKQYKTGKYETQEKEKAKRTCVSVRKIDPAELPPKGTETHSLSIYVFFLGKQPCACPCPRKEQILALPNFGLRRVTLEFCYHNPSHRIIG